MKKKNLFFEIAKSIFKFFKIRAYRVSKADDARFSTHQTNNKIALISIGNTLGLLAVFASITGTFFPDNIAVLSGSVANAFFKDKTTLVSVGHLLISAAAMYLFWLRIYNNWAALYHSSQFGLLRKLFSFTLGLTLFIFILPLIFPATMFSEFYFWEAVLLSVCFLLALIFSIFVKIYGEDELENIKKEGYSSISVKLNQYCREKKYNKSYNNEKIQELCKLESISYYVNGWITFNLSSFLFTLIYALFIKFEGSATIGLFSEHIVSTIQGVEWKRTDYGDAYMHYYFAFMIAASGFLGVNRVHWRSENLGHDTFKDEVFLLNCAIKNGSIHNSENGGKRTNATEATSVDQAKQVSDDNNPQNTAMKQISNGWQKLIAMTQLTRMTSSILGSGVIYFISESLIHFSLSLIFLMFSFAFNDFIDFTTGKDKACHPSRALPSGKLSVSDAYLISAILGSLCVLLAIHMNWPIMIPLLIGSSIYSLFLKRLIPSVATAFWCGIVTILALYPISPPWYLYSVFFAFFYAREILLDLRDVEADDLFCATPSLASILKNKTFVFTVLMLLVAGGIGILEENNVVILAGMLSALVCSGIFLSKISINQKIKFASFLLWMFFPLIVFA
jgi:4-hydroxybenzoate polyprenyltransferase